MIPRRWEEVKVIEALFTIPIILLEDEGTRVFDELVASWPVSGEGCCSSTPVGGAGGRCAPGSWPCARMETWAQRFQCFRQEMRGEPRVGNHPPRAVRERDQ
jgi:hypothetical protein